MEVEKADGSAAGLFADATLPGRDAASEPAAPSGAQTACLIQTAR